MPRKSKKKYVLWFLAIAVILIFKSNYQLFSFSKQTKEINFENKTKKILLDDNGLKIETRTQAKTVKEYLEKNKIVLAKYDQITPSLETPLYSRTHLHIKRAQEVKILVDKRNFSVYTFKKTVGAVLGENNIHLSRLDKTLPNLNALVTDKTEIVVTRINVEQVTKKEAIKFKTVIKTTSKLGWREKKIKQKGELGIKEVTYQITYKNEKKVSQIVLKTKIINQPKEQIELRGSYFKLGKSHKGQGTWYTQPLSLKVKYNPLVDNFAASTTLAKGSYAKVTNKTNGKSIIVQISDFGPQGKGRIIDLDKKAFAQIASLGAGVIKVKVAPVLN